MLDLCTFKTELTFIVNNLAKSVVRETTSKAEKKYLSKRLQRNEERARDVEDEEQDVEDEERTSLIPQETQTWTSHTNEELDAFVDDLCTNAINNIYKIIELSLTTDGDTEAERRSKSTLPPPTEPATKEDKVSRPAEGGLKLTNASGQSQTYILIYGSAVIDAKYPLSSQVSDISVNDIHKHGATEGDDVCKTRPSEVSTPPAPLTPECLDHEYALPSAMAAGSAAREQDCSAARKRKRRPGGRKKKSSAQYATSQKKKQQQQLASVTEHECHRCGRLFPDVQQLEDHEKKKHLDCGVCGEEFSGVVKLREHLVDVHRLMPYSCDYCDKTFNHKAHHTLHVRTHTGEKTCYCDICGKGYSCISVLKMHRMSHFDKTFICDLCGKGFYQACHLTRHKHIHKEVRPFHCDVCGKGFNQAENLKTHKITHTGEKQLCAICGKNYRYLSSHMIIKHAHDITIKEVPLTKDVITCDVCGKKYLHASQYKLHKMTHTGEKPYHCDICGKSFRLKDTLKDHRYIHTGERPYKCTTCGKTFPSTPSYRRHTSIHTGEMPYHCKVCGKRFRLLTFLKAHQKTQGHLRLKMKEASAGNGVGGAWVAPV